MDEEYDLALDELTLSCQQGRILISWHNRGSSRVLSLSFGDWEKLVEIMDGMLAWQEDEE
jgi:hypothetical protein